MAWVGGVVGDTYDDETGAAKKLETSPGLLAIAGQLAKCGFESRPT